MLPFLSQKSEAPNKMSQNYYLKNYMLNQIKIYLCKQENKYVIENLIQFYCYDLIQYSKHANYQFMQNGLFENIPYFDNYWLEDKRYPYLITQDQTPIGFALVHDITLNKNADWKMAEFFIFAPYRRKGIGQHVVKTIFKQHPGLWEISVLNDNEIAKNFWQRLLSQNSIHHYYAQYPQYIVYETIA